MIMKKKALLLTIRNTLEFNFTTIYRWAFLGEVVDAIESTNIWSVDVFDGAVYDAYFDDYIKRIQRSYDLLIFYTDPQTSSLVKRVCDYCKVISPSTKILVYGRATIFLPQYFSRFPFDAVHVSGDREIVIRDYALYLSECLKFDELTGLKLVCSNKVKSTKDGKKLKNEHWYFPKLEKLPIDQYKKLYKKKNRIFEYGITVSKGCEKKCKYCETWRDQGCVDRRRNPEEIISWISSINEKEPWIIQLWSSNFFYDKNWVKKFCNTYIAMKANFRWRAVGRYDDIDSSTIERISECKCFEIAVGVETIFKEKIRTLKGTVEKLLEVHKDCNDYNVRLKCLLMVGMPYQCEEDVHFAIKLLKQNKINFRFTSYTPLHKLIGLSVDDLDVMNLSNFDRRTYYDLDSNFTQDFIIKTILGLH